MKQEETFVLEWSASQQAFHIQLLDAALGANQRRFVSRPDNSFEWIPLFVGSYRECEAVARANEQKLARRRRTETELIGWTH